MGSFNWFPVVLLNPIIGNQLILRQIHRLGFDSVAVLNGFSYTRWKGRCKALPVRPQGQFINRVKVPVGVSHNVVAESNCVIAKWGGEQLEAKGQSAG